MKLIFLIIIFLLFPFLVFSSSLYISPQTKEVKQGDVFVQELYLNTEGKMINAVEVSLSFPSFLKFQELSKGNSILSLWVEEPSLGSDVLSFSGGTPAGFGGEKGLLAKMVFKAEREGQGFLELSGSKVFLNDGLGTESDLTFQRAFIASSAGQGEADEWQEILEQDKNPPEIFKIELKKDPLLFEGKYFILFSTQDKQSGLDYYEVKEGDREWEKGTSPYLLWDQRMKGIIQVKAVDKAGNESIVSYQPRELFFPFIIVFILIILLAIIVLSFYFLRRWKRKS